MSTLGRAGRRILIIVTGNPLLWSSFAFSTLVYQNGCLEYQICDGVARPYPNFDPLQ